MNRFTATIAVAVALTATTAAGAHADGNSDAAHACQKGGYMTLVRADGSTFANVGDCVSYAANGGVLQPATTSATLSAIVLSADNALTAGYELGGIETVIGSKPFVRGTVSLPDVKIGPFPTGTTLRVFLRDDTCGATYYSDGFHARVVGDNPYEVDIADAGPGCRIETSPWAGTGEGNLSLSLTVG